MTTEVEKYLKLFGEAKDRSRLWFNNLQMTYDLVLPTTLNLIGSMKHQDKH